MDRTAAIPPCATVIMSIICMTATSIIRMKTMSTST
jgi:hypothetical protein